MRDRHENLIGRVKPVHPHEWLWAPLADDPTFVLRAMFGTKAVYLEGRLMLCFCAREEPWRGVLVCTERTHHAALRDEFPGLVPHPILPKWLYLPESDDAFERIAGQLVTLARKRDVRLGIIPGQKKKRGGGSVLRPQASAMTGGPVHFASGAAFRRWLNKHHATARDMVVAFHKKASGRGGMSYAAALDEALCFGWIDGIRRRLDDNTYTIRFTPRKARSIWSRINIGHVQRLVAAQRMHPAGHAAFAARDAKKSGVYSFEQRPQEFPPAMAKVFQKNRKAWAYWSEQPRGYRQTAIWWVISAKQPATRARRLERLIADAAAGRRLGMLERRKK